MSIRERYARLEERERRLLTVLVAFLGAVIVLAPPLALVAVVHSSRGENEAVREALQVVVVPATADPAVTAVLQRLLRHMGVRPHRFRARR